MFLTKYSIGNVINILLGMLQNILLGMFPVSIGNVTKFEFLLGMLQNILSGIL